MLTSDYLKVNRIIRKNTNDEPVHVLSLTNFEVKRMFSRMIEDWFAQTEDFGEFVKAMSCGEEEAMNDYMNEVALNTFSYYDSEKGGAGRKHPERFCHGFILGLMVEKADGYMVKSNRESGYGCYDVVMEPKDAKNVAVIMEFKVLNKNAGEESLEYTAKNALKQIEDKKYDTDLLQRGIPTGKILKYGFAFEGEKCLIRKA